MFVAIELPDDASPAQRSGFARGEGGALVPRMCVDKAPDELGSFAQLQQEAAQTGAEWGMVFAAALGGSAGRPPSSADAAPVLDTMVESIRQGRIAAYIPFDTQGRAVRLG